MFIDGTGMLPCSSTWFWKMITGVTDIHTDNADSFNPFVVKLLQMESEYVGVCLKIN